MENLQTKLFEAAKQGSINSLQQLLKDDPLILDRAAVSSFNETPLHVAAMLCHVDFVKEIIHIKPELLDEVNSQKSTALHMAAGKGHIEVVRALLSANGGACLVLDRNKLTPLHLAAAKGRVEVVKLLLEAQPDAAYRGENILHLCVKRNQLEALEMVMKSLGDEGGFINSADEHGNTVLHLAVADKQVETVKFLISMGIEANAVNKEGMTAVDILIRSKRDVRDSEIETSLKHNTNNSSKIVGRRSKDEKNNWGSSLKQHENLVKKNKNALMVVASLIATMAFQVGVNPPGGVWQDHHATNALGNRVGVVAGTSVFGRKNPILYKFFYMLNTIAFIASLSIILLLMSGLPLRRRFFMWMLTALTWASIAPIALCYFIAVAAMTPTLEDFTTTVELGYMISITVLLWMSLMGLLLVIHTVRLAVKPR